MSAELAAIRVETAFVLDDAGRILQNSDPDRGPGPRMALAGWQSGNVLRIRHDVAGETARAIEALTADEPPLRDPWSVPRHADEYEELLAAEAPIVQRGSGLGYSFPPDLAYDHDVTLVSSDMPDTERARLGVANDRVLPDALVSIGFSTIGRVWQPWCLALHDGEIASVAETVRRGPRGAEVGVDTVPTLRGRGFAAAATAGWASLPSLRGRALFYSTDVTNVSSQRVTERLRLRFLGATFAIT